MDNVLDVCFSTGDAGCRTEVAGTFPFPVAGGAEVAEVGLGSQNEGGKIKNGNRTILYSKKKDTH